MTLLTEKELDDLRLVDCASSEIQLVDRAVDELQLFHALVKHAQHYAKSKDLQHFVDQRCSEYILKLLEELKCKY